MKDKIKIMIVILLFILALAFYFLYSNNQQIKNSFITSTFQDRVNQFRFNYLDSPAVQENETLQEILNDLNKPKFIWR